jgi:hypothetical protein
MSANEVIITYHILYNCTNIAVRYSSATIYYDVRHARRLIRGGSLGIGDAAGKLLWTPSRIVRHWAIASKQHLTRSAATASRRSACYFYKQHYCVSRVACCCLLRCESCLNSGFCASLCTVLLALYFLLRGDDETNFSVYHTFTCDGSVLLTVIWNSNWV